MLGGLILMYNESLTINGDSISPNTITTKGINKMFKEYDIQIVDINPGDTILLHINDDMDIESVASIVKEMNEIYPENTIIPVNEWVLKGMTILRQSKKVDDVVNEFILDKPLSELYPELFPSTSAPPGGIIW